jgi:phosphoribosylaminoimidazolecarboxamide formyltransferase/IMP cyclohydrolase
MPELVRIQRALVSVSDKADLAPLARALHGLGIEIISTGGTARAIAEAGVPVTAIEDLTGFPEIMDGRVKTLHPMVHGGLLALRDKPEHQEQMARHGIKPIDLVCVNLYPFERTVSQPGVDRSEAIEQIDIGGPSMIRSAAKNFDHVCVVTSPKQYDRLANELQMHDGAVSLTLRAEFAAAAFARTAEYDAAISTFLGRRVSPPFPDVLNLRYAKVDTLRYGENPHQDAALYRDPASTGPSIVNSEQVHGKPLSYNNINDAAAALELVKDFRRIAPGRVGAAVIKHTNACGCAVGDTALDAVNAALAGDPLAAFGGILAVNATLDLAAAEALCREGVFLEVIAAASFDADARETLTARSAALRLLAVGEKSGSPALKLDYRSIPGGMLVQTRDTRIASPEQWQHVAGPAPSAGDFADAAVVWTIAKHLKSNAVAVGGREAGVGPVRLFGAGAGLMDRVTACRLAIEKAGANARGAIAASDAFFPFPDGPETLINAGVRLIVHPGGSKRDQETFDLCNERGVACLVTGRRHFRH